MINGGMARVPAMRITFAILSVIATICMLVPAFGLNEKIMYSDDPADCTSPEEIALSKEITGLIKKYDDEEFGLQQTGTDQYKLFTRSGKYEGEIDLGSKHICKIFETGVQEK